MCRCLYMWVCRDTHVTHLYSHNLRSRHIRQFSPHTHQYLKWMFVCVSKNNSIVWFSDYDTPENTYYILLIIHVASRIKLSSTEKTKKVTRVDVLAWCNQVSRSVSKLWLSNQYISEYVRWESNLQVGLLRMPSIVAKILFQFLSRTSLFHELDQSSSWNRFNVSRKLKTFCRKTFYRRIKQMQICLRYVHAQIP